MPSKRSPGSSVTVRARATAASAVSTPQRSMPVSTSTMTPSTAPAPTAAADSAAALSASSTATRMRGARRQLGQQADLGRVRHRVDHEDVVKPGAGQHGRLPHGRRGQPARARFHLPPGQLRALVRLVVRPDGGRPDLGERGRHVVDVALRRVDVEYQRRGDQLLAALADVASVLAQDVVPGLVELPSCLPWSKAADDTDRFPSGT